MLQTLRMAKPFCLSSLRRAWKRSRLPSGAQAGMAHEPVPTIRRAVPSSAAAAAPDSPALLAAPADDRLERVFRRILADLGTDLYVAEDERGEIVGLVSVLYARSLARGGRSALLDGARARRPALLAELVAFAEERARKRGCRRLAAWVD